MSSVVSLVTACMFSLHAMSGCCLHHAHASDAQHHSSQCQHSATHDERHATLSDDTQQVDSIELEEIELEHYELEHYELEHYELEHYELEHYDDASRESQPVERECHAYPCQYDAPLPSPLAAWDFQTLVVPFAAVLNSTLHPRQATTWHAAVIDSSSPPALPRYLALQTLLI